ncbi:protein of unknown function [Oenococcus oeni]|nr:hypothetical protein OENI_110043 [Oenococcus oeni]SYW01067.1 hypothetical protein OENI_30245 [Oenococcus oeni]SYW14471.1 hypothetical protein OENI_500015 [Oenococcus oeni]SYW18429.1 hypothetical protein OENI_30243 [Oenococcus oeni]VDC14082.1 protein of unknown function [Oenococcus oeni]
MTIYQSDRKRPPQQILGPIRPFLSQSKKDHKEMTIYENLNSI